MSKLPIPSFFWLTFYFLFFLAPKRQVSAQNLNCSYIQNSTNGSFPDEFLLGYGESRIVSLLDYWKGINLTYSIENQSSLPPNLNVTLPNKIQEIMNGSLDDLIETLDLGEIVDVYFDSRSPQNINSETWAAASLIVLLTEKNGNYSLTIGNISSFINMEGFQTINLAFLNSTFTLKCFKTTYVGTSIYYVDCVGTENVTSGLWINFFLIVDATNDEISLDYIVKGNNFPMNIMLYKREMKYAESEYPYILRYYNGFNLVTSFSTYLEIWNVSVPNDPQLVNFYNGSDSSIHDIWNNISVVEASINLLYIATCGGSLYFIQDWTQPVNFAQGELPNIVDTMAFKSVLIRSSNLLYITPTTSDLIQDTLILIGDNENTQYLTMVIQSFSSGISGLSTYYGSTFVNYFNLPLPIYPKSYFVDVKSIAQTQSFFTVSYKVSAFGSTVDCYYTGIFEFTGPPNSCHSLIPYTDKTVMDYTKFDPLGESSTFVALSKDKNWIAWNVSLPYMYLTNITQNATIALSVGGTINNINLVVQDPDSTQILSQGFESTISRKGPTAAFLLNSGFTGPSLKFKVDFLGEEIPHAIFEDHPISTNWAPSIEKLIAFHDHYVDRNGVAKLFFSKNGKKYISYADMTSNSLYNINLINFYYTFALDLNFKQYFSINGMDILITEYNNKAHLVFADLKFTIKDIKIIYNVSISELVRNCTNYQMQALETNFVLLCIQDGSSVYNLTISSNPFSIMSSYQIPNENIGVNYFSNPIVAKMHPAYPYTMFVLCENNIFILNVTHFSNNGTENAIPIYSIIPIPNVTDDNPAILQPFLNKLFLIYPKVNQIYEYDISDIQLPYYIRTLGLFTYDISILFSPLVHIGFGYSPVTDVMYLVANNTMNGNIEMLVLTPNDANSYLLDNILIAESGEIDDNSSISIDCTTVSEETIGDVVAVVFDGTIELYEIYSSSSLIIGIPSVSNMSMNEVHNLMINASNPWCTTPMTSLFNLTVYDDEELINRVNPLTFPYHSTSISFPINLFFSGTIYSMESNTTGLIVDPIVVKTPVQYDFNSTIVNFTVINTWVTPDNIYMLGDSQISIFNIEKNETMGTISYDNTDAHCYDIAIDNNEAFGVVSCVFNNGSTGLITFFVQKFTESNCNLTLTEDFMQLKPSEEFQLIFFLTNVNQNAAIITVHEIGPGGCLTKNSLYNLPEWLLPTNNPNLTAFDVLFTNVSYEIFIVNSNFGLNIVNLDLNVDNSFAELVWSNSFDSIFGEWMFLPEDMAILDVAVIEKEKIRFENTFTIQLLLVFQNYHSFLVTFNISNSFENIIMSESKKVFMLPQEFLVLDWSISSSYLALIVLNTTEESAGVYTLFYNIFDNQSFYQNRMNPNDPNTYISVVWNYQLMDNYSSYVQEFTNIENLLFMYDCNPNGTSGCNLSNTTTMMYFSNLLEQEILTYNVLQNITVRWESSDDIATSDEFYINIINNLQTVNYYIPFTDVPPFWTEWWVLSLLAMLFVVMVYLIRYIYRRFKSKQAVVYSRKKQADPLKFLLDLHNQNDLLLDKDESMLH